MSRREKVTIEERIEAAKLEDGRAFFIAPHGEKEEHGG